MVIAFTGHRPEKIGGYLPNPATERLRRTIRGCLEHLEAEEVISGMALGVDQLVAEECIGLGLPLIAAVPFAGQESKWPKASQDHYRTLLAAASKVHVVCSGPYSPQHMQERNKWMVDRADILVAVWDGSRGGTYNCVQYGKAVGVPIYRINPAVDPNDRFLVEYLPT